MKLPKGFIPQKNLDRKTESLLRYSPTKNLKDMQEKIIRMFNSNEELLEPKKFTQHTWDISNVSTVNYLGKTSNQKLDYLPFMELLSAYHRTIVLPKNLKSVEKQIIPNAQTPQEEYISIIFNPNKSPTKIILPYVKDLFLIRKDPDIREAEDFEAVGNKEIIESLKIERKYEINFKLRFKYMMVYQAMLDANHPKIEEALLEAYETFQEFSQQYKHLEKHYDNANCPFMFPELYQGQGYKSEKEKLHNELIREMNCAFQKNNITLNAI